MPPQLLLITQTAALLFLFTALGSAPVMLLMRGSAIQIVAAPVVGFAVAACLLTTSSRFLALDVAAWTVLVPAAVVSLATAVVFGMRRREPFAGRQVLFPMAAALVGAAAALLPPLLHRTQGPFTLAIYDAWGYAASSDWLQHHSTMAALPPTFHQADMTLVVGRGFASGDARIGVDSVVAAAASLFRVDTAAAISVLLAALFALVPLVVWIVARELGLSYFASSLAVALSLTPALLTMVEDTALGNLGGIVLVPMLLLFVVRSVTKGLGRDIAMAGLFLGALLAVFPEFFPPLALVVVVDIAVLASFRRSTGTARWLGATAMRLTLIGAVGVALAPYAVYRAVSYLGGIGHENLALPPRGLTVANAGAWAFGLLHLYELPSLGSLSPARMAFALYFPAVLALIVLNGLRRRPVDALLFVFVPVAVAIGFGFYVYQRYQGEHCEYCLWKALTEMIPFLVIGVGIGVDRFGVRRPSGGRGLLLQLPVVIVALIALVAVGRADARLVRETDQQGVFYPQRLRSLGATLDRLPKGSLVMIEGTSAMERPPFMLPAAYYEAQAHGMEVSFDAVQPAPAYLGVPPDTSPYYSSDYRYVLSPFGDVASDRTTLGQYGPFTFQRRAPVDVVLSTTQWALEPSGTQVPSFTAPFELKISSRLPGTAALTLTLGTRADGGTVALASGGRQLQTRVSVDGETVCAVVPIRRGSTVVAATPLAPLGVTPPGQLGLVSIRGVHAERGRRCDEPVGEALAFDAGWYPTEVGGAQRPFRWMGGTATIRIGAARSDRPALRFRADVSSFQIPRRVEVRLGAKLLTTLEAPVGRTAQLDVTVPPGRGQAVLTLVASPPSLPASVVTPGDPRLLSLALSDAKVRRVSGAREQTASK